MIAYAEFSRITLADLFADDPLGRGAFPADPEERDFAWEWLGGEWHQDQIPGVTLSYPSEGSAKLGGVELALPIPGLEDRYITSGKAGDASLQGENADRVLARLGVPFKFRDDLATVEAATQALKPRNVERNRVADLGLTYLDFVTPRPEPYRFDLIVHDALGLLSLVMYRPDLAKKNAFDG